MVLGGALPWVRPNIDPSREEMPQFAALMPESSGPSDWWCGTLCCLTGVLAPYVCARRIWSTRAASGSDQRRSPVADASRLEPADRPLERVSQAISRRRPPDRGGAGDDRARAARRVGLATDNTQLQLLLPGTHARTSALFKFHKIEGLASQLVEFSQIRFVTVPTGFVRVGFLNGAVIALTEGRYAINTPVFRIGPEVDVRQENMKFSKHQVCSTAASPSNAKVCSRTRSSTRSC